MKYLLSVLLLPVVMAVFTLPALALDPPHDLTSSVHCASCHTSHAAPGMSLTSVAGNANLCLSCHLVGGPATAKPLTDADQALPAPGLPPGTEASGTSHRWDSGHRAMSWLTH